MPTPKKPTKLKNISVDEVSIVDEPATRRRFMFWKSADGGQDSAFEKQFKSLDVAFKSDGTAGGSSLEINGKAISELDSITLSAAPVGESMSIYCAYTQGAKGQTAGGFRPTYTYTLSKADHAVPAGTAPLSKRLDPEDVNTVQAYINELPPRLRRSVENLVGAVQSLDEPIAKEEEGVTVPEPKTQDGEVPPAPPAVDLTGVTEKLDKLTEAMGAIAEKVTAIETADKDRQAAIEQAAKDAAEHAAAVGTGEEIEFESEDEANAAVAAEAHKEAVEEAGTTT
ncbi:MAG TPA: hypothetical protein VMY35_10625 [Phycisphaerae bacterium]|nr:hypothetical protein [Phycisphaerae bacterium]